MTTHSYMKARQDKFIPIRITGGRPFAGSTVTYDGSKYSVVRDHEPGEKTLTIRSIEDFHTDPITVPLNECGDALFVSSGSYFSFDCAQHCLNLSGKPYPNLMCWACSQIPFKHDFIKKFTRRTENIKSNYRQI